MRTTHIQIRDKLRYKSAGDYFERRGETVIHVVKQDNIVYEFLIALHEFYEQFATELDGVKEEDILAWDLDHPDADEPGELEGSPYRLRHQQAETLERVVCLFLGVDFDKYSNEIKVSE